MGSKNNSNSDGKCGFNCFRYFPQNKGQTQQDYVCYVGSSEGRIMSLGESCIWADVFQGSIDRGTPRTAEESELFAKFLQKSSHKGIQTPDEMARQVPEL